MIKFVLNVPLQSASFRYPFSSSIEMFIVRPCMRPQQAFLLFSSGASLLLRPLLQQKIFLIFAKIFRLVYGDKDFIEGGGYMTAHSQIDAFTYLVAKVYSFNQLRVEQTGAVGDGARALINVVFYHLLTNIIEL